VADTAPVGQADVPDPAAALRGGGGLRGDRAVLERIGDLQRQRAVVEQHVLLVQEGNLEMLTQQQRAHAGAIDEQVAREQAVRLRAQ
jgi:hypothetical protein